VTSGTYISHLQTVFKSAGVTVSHFFSMLPSTLKYIYSDEPVRMHLYTAVSLENAFWLVQRNRYTSR
jgi:hypothetical protein